MRRSWACNRRDGLGLVIAMGWSWAQDCDEAVLVGLRIMVRQDWLTRGGIVLTIGLTIVVRQDLAHDRNEASVLGL
jgi:hypothetical protein